MRDIILGTATMVLFTLGVLLGWYWRDTIPEDNYSTSVIAVEPSSPDTLIVNNNAYVREQPPQHITLGGVVYVRVDSLIVGTDTHNKAVKQSYDNPSFFRHFNSEPFIRGE